MAKVLVVEDNPVNMKLAVLLLHGFGHTVLCVGDAEAGLELARAELPDLILMDVQLPGMDGLTATAHLKRDARTAAIPVIALTAMVTKGDQDLSDMAGCAAYLAKPLRYKELHAAINVVLFAEKSPGLLEDARPGGASSPQSSSDAISQAAAAVDVGVLEGLIGNDPVVIADFVKAFRISSAKIALELIAACTEGQAVQAGRHAHKLNSSAHIVGALVLGGLCAKIEAAGRAGRLETLMALLPLFEQELGAVNAFLDALPLPLADHVI